MEIVMVRHGQPEWIRNGRNVSDPPLTELGQRQAQAMADVLAQQHWDEVVVSPLQRARQTAAPLYAALGMRERIEPWLEEIRDPEWHGTPADYSRAMYEELAARPIDDRWHGLEGGESARSFTARIHAGATDFLERRGIRRIDHELPYWTVANPDLRVAVVAHAGTNSVVMCTLLGLRPTPWEWDRFVTFHASVSRVETIPVHEGFTVSLTSLSNVEHLTGGDRSR